MRKRITAGLLGVAAVVALSGCSKLDRVLIVNYYDHDISVTFDHKRKFEIKANAMYYDYFYIGGSGFYMEVRDPTGKILSQAIRTKKQLLADRLGNELFNIEFGK